MLRSTLIVCAAALALSAPPALAQTETQSRVVEYGDLNLNHPHDADRLINRIETAANSVCDDHRGRNISVLEAVDEARCDYHAETNAIYDVGHPMVSERYYQRRPQVIIEGSYDPDPYYPRK